MSLGVSKILTTCFDCILLNSAWSRAHKFHVNAAQKAEDLFFKQRKLSKVDKLGDRVKPDFQTYTTCIMSLVESKTITNKMKRALRLLDFILDSVSRGEMPVSRNPNAPFSAALSVIASCDDKTIEQKGTSLSPSLDKTNDNSVDGFTAVVDTDTDPYTVAKSIFAQVDGDAHGIGTFVDHHVATSFLRCISTHCATGSTERQHTATRVFESACSDGQVSRSVVEGIKDALGPGIESFPHFFAKRRPKSWSRNVEIKFR